MGLMRWGAVAALLLLLAALSACGDTEVRSTPGPASANLAAIAITPGEIDQFFQPNLGHYTSTQGFPVASVRVVPTAADEDAAILVDGTAVRSGEESQAIPLEVGVNEIAISVTGADGQVSRDYVLTVTRQFEPEFAQEAYIKASNTGANDRFGFSIALSGDTLVVGAPYEASAATGIDGDQADDSAPEAGAVYVFVRDGDAWAQQAYIKADNAGAGDRFGWSIALDGDTLAVGAYREDSSASGVNGDGLDNGSPNSGAVYVYTRTGGAWSQQAYIKAPEVIVPPPAIPGQPPHPQDFRSGNQFGWSVALAGDVLAVGATFERSGATGVGGNQASVAAPNAGAVYVYTRAGADWSAPPVYIKASNAGGGDQFGYSLALNGDTLAVGAPYEDSDAIGVGGNQPNNRAVNSGAVYVFALDGAVWTQQAYVKASNTAAFDSFGLSVALSGDTLAVGAPYTGSTVADVPGPDPRPENPADYDPSTSNSGAVYVFTRSGAAWSQQAYLKADTADAGDLFGYALSLSGDVLLVGAVQEDGGGVGGLLADPADDSAQNSGAAYVFTRGNETWSQLSYLKASNTSRFDWFGHSVAVSGDTLAVAAPLEDSSATGIGGDEADGSAEGSGAIYVFR